MIQHLRALRTCKAISAASKLPGLRQNCKSIFFKGTPLLFPLKASSSWTLFFCFFYFLNIYILHHETVSYRNSWHNLLIGTRLFFFFFPPLFFANDTHQRRMALCRVALRVAVVADSGGSRHQGGRPAPRHRRPRHARKRLATSGTGLDGHWLARLARRQAGSWPLAGLCPGCVCLPYSPACTAWLCQP